jgi:hypothetical protein
MLQNKCILKLYRLFVRAVTTFILIKKSQNCWKNCVLILGSSNQKQYTYLNVVLKISNFKFKLRPQETLLSDKALMSV